MGTRRHGQGEDIYSPEKCFVLQMLSKVSVDEVFMHYFKKISSASGGIVPRPPPELCLRTPLETSVLQTPSLPTPEKNPAGAYRINLLGGTKSLPENKQEMCVESSSITQPRIVRLY